MVQVWLGLEKRVMKPLTRNFKINILNSCTHTAMYTLHRHISCICTHNIYILTLFQIKVIENLFYTAVCSKFQKLYSEHKIILMIRQNDVNANEYIKWYINYTQPKTTERTEICMLYIM